MDDTPAILLTNDDGIDSAGFRALYDALSAFAEVIAVAPAEDQSAVGRRMSNEVEVAEHELGYAVAGTPADCVVAGLEAICPDVDLVVAGCNKGANLGAYVLGRSGTVSAAVEATFFDVPAIAVSLYVPGDADWETVATAADDYRNASDTTAYLVRHALPAGVFEGADYLNVNAPPWEGEPAGMEITEPSLMYEITAERADERVRLHDNVWDRMLDEDFSDRAGTDRQAIVEGRVSVSPLLAPHAIHHHDALDELAESYLD